MSRKSRNVVLWAIACLTVALVLSSCNRKVVYSHYAHTPVDGWGWERSDSLFFEVPPVAVAGTYAEEVGLRCKSSYPFTELSLIVIQSVEPYGIHRRDTVLFQLTNEDGVFLGEGVNYYQYVQALPEIYLHEDDVLHVSICHFMKRESLPGISDVGFTLRSVEVQ